MQSWFKTICGQIGIKANKLNKKTSKPCTKFKVSGFYLQILFLLSSSQISIFIIQFNHVVFCSAFSLSFLLVLSLSLL